ncbi:MAG TPA: hypothetical protein VE954_27535 [Oligoflexus sp.]|nr:hypothetical protein [Oligoflexus sp.]
MLSTGLGTWQSDTTFQVPGDLETIQKGVHILWRFKVELLTNEDLPKKLEDYTPGMLDGSQPLEVKEVKSMLDVGMGRALSDYYSGSSGPRPIEISCKKPFTYKFSFEDSSDANGVCRKKAGSSQSECLVAGIAFTGDQCIVKGTDIEILDKSGKLIKFGFEGILSNGRHDSGEQNYSLAISTVKLK